MAESLKYRNALVVINVLLAFFLGIGIGAVFVSRYSQSSVATEQPVDLDLTKDAIAP